MLKRYTLYTSNDCSQCSNVQDFLERKSIECLTINVDDEGDSPPEPVFIYPVLFLNDKLLAYGLDIIEHFQLISNRP
jgi:glutaredoxin